MPISPWTSPSFQRLMNVTSDSVVVAAGGSVVAASHTLAERLGIPASAIIGESVDSLRSRRVLDVASGLGNWRCLDRDDEASIWRLDPAPTAGTLGPAAQRDRQRQANLYAEVSLRLATSSGGDLDRSINEILRAIAAAEGADRAYVIEFLEVSGSRLIRCTHEWCATGIDAQIDYVQNLSTEGFPWSVGTLLDRRVVHIPDFALSPPEAAPERESFERYGVKSVLQVPMMMDGQVVGLVGFNAVTDQMHWSDDTIVYVRGVCDALATALTRVRAREAVDAAREEAEVANLAKSSFLSRMSHELRTPLNAVMGFTELMLTEDGRDDADLESLQAVYESAEHLLALVEDVLDISRVEAGGLSIDLEPTLVIEQVEAALRMVGVAGINGSSSVSLSALSSIDAQVDADPHRLQQILVNLISNACKYSRPGGTTEVSWIKQVVAETGAEEVVISVTDNGTGIDPEALHRVFEPFDRLGQEHTSIQGTGIGLTLTKMLVELMGGSIQVTSTLGEGTTVEVVLASS